MNHRNGVVVMLGALMALGACNDTTAAPTTGATADATSTTSTTVSVSTTTTIDPYALAPPDGYQVEEFPGLGLRVAVGEEWTFTDTSGGFLATLARLLGEDADELVDTRDEYLYADPLILTTAASIGDPETMFVFVYTIPYDPSLALSLSLARIAERVELSETVSAWHTREDDPSTGAREDVYYIDHPETTLVLYFRYPGDSMVADDVIGTVLGSVRLRHPTARYLCSRRDEAFELYRVAILLQLDQAELATDAWDRGEVSDNKHAGDLTNFKSEVMSYVYAIQQTDGLIGEAAGVAETLERLGLEVAGAFDLASLSVRLGDAASITASRDRLDAATDELETLDVSVVGQGC